MRTVKLLLAIPLVAFTLGCGPTLTRGPAGWHESSLHYTIAPLADGTLFPGGWGLAGFELKDAGYRRDPDVVLGIDFEFLRTADDGALTLTTYPLDEADRGKLSAVLADRWLTRIVRNPSITDEDTETFARVVALRKVTAASGGWAVATATALSGRSVQIDEQATFPVPGGEGAEFTTTLSPLGSPPDRRLYVAAIKQTGGERFVLVAYGNSLIAFDAGLADAAAFARRIRF
jgi:hypothetical protein